MYSESAVPEFNDSMNTKVNDVSSENWSKDSCGPNLGQPGFENIDPPQWKQYDRQQSNYMKEVETCVLRIKIWTQGLAQLSISTPHKECLIARMVMTTKISSNLFEIGLNSTDVFGSWGILF